MQTVPQFLSFNTGGHAASGILLYSVQLTCYNTFNNHLNHTAGAPRFCLLSPVVAYSVCLYILVLVSLYCSVTERIAKFLDRRDFNDKVYIILHICTSLCSMFLPIFMAFDTKKLVHYASEWVLFQVGCTLKD
jgi:hypothetical protein